MPAKIDMLRLAIVLIGITLSIYGLYVVNAGKMIHTDPEPASDSAKIVVQLRGFALFFLGLVLMPTGGLLLKLMGN